MHVASDRGCRSGFQRFFLAVAVVVSPVVMGGTEGLGFDPSCPGEVNGAALLPSTAFSKINNAFSWKVLNGLQASQPQDNLHFGGLSATIALQMLQNGAKDETRVEIAQLLGNRGQRMPELNASARDLLKQFASGQTDEVLRVANSLWTDDTGFSFDPGYAGSMLETFQALVKTVSFRSPKTVPEINQWVSDRTQKMIPELLKSLPPGVVMLLLNATYFEGQWVTPFYEHATKPVPFAVRGGKLVPVLTMQSEEIQGAYAESAGFTFASMPFSRDKEGSMGQFALDLIVPKDPAGATVLTQVQYEALLQAAQRQKLGVVVPKARFENNFKLKDLFESMGMRRAFNGDDAQLQPMGISRNGNLYATDVIHGTAFEMDEKGLKVAAATAVPGAAESIAVGPDKFLRADRPYYFVVRHVPSGTTVNMGRITAPSWEKEAAKPATTAAKPTVSVPTSTPVTATAPDSPELIRLAGLLYGLFSTDDAVSLASENPQWDFAGDFATFALLSIEGVTYGEGLPEDASDADRILAFVKAVIASKRLPALIAAVKAIRPDHAAQIEERVKALEKQDSTLGETQHFRARRFTTADTAAVNTWDPNNSSWVISHSTDIPATPDWGKRFNFAVTPKKGSNVVGGVYLKQPALMTDNESLDGFRWASTPYAKAEKDWAIIRAFALQERPPTAAYAEIWKLGAKVAFEKLGIQKLFVRLDPQWTNEVAAVEAAGFRKIADLDEWVEMGDRRFVYYELAAPTGN